MKKIIVIFTIICCLIFCMTDDTNAQDEMEIWKDFLKILYDKENDFPPDKVRPYYPSFKEPMLGFLKTISQSVPSEDFEGEPEIIIVEGHIHFIISLTEGDQEIPYSFTFFIENNEWYFKHMETITIRLDKISDFPVSEFPDLPEHKIYGILEETRIGKIKG